MRLLILLDHCGQTSGEIAEIKSASIKEACKHLGITEYYDKESEPEYWFNLPSGERVFIHFKQLPEYKEITSIDDLHQLTQKAQVALEAKLKEEFENRRN